MKRTFWLTGLLVAGVAAVPAIYFGIPAYAEMRVADTLDSQIAATPRPADGGWSALKVDYWHDRMELGELRWPIEPGLLPGVDVPAVVVVSGISIEGYDRSALQRALGPGVPDGNSDLLLRRLDWSGVRLVSPDGSATYATAQAGSLTAPSLDHFDFATWPAGLAFERFESGPVTAALPDGTHGVIAGLSVSGLADRGAEAVQVGAVVASGKARNPDGTDAVLVEFSLQGLTAQGVILGEVIEVAGIETGAQGIKVSDGSGKPFVVASVGKYSATGLRQDPAIATFYRDLVDLLRTPPADGAAGIEDIKAENLERVVSMLERSEALQTGIAHARAENVAVAIPNIAEYRFGSIEIAGARGLKVDRGEVLAQSNSSVDGAASRTALQVIEGVDLSGLPAWIRAMTGGQVTAESLATLEARFAGLTLAEFIPPFDFGRTTAEGMVVELKGKPLIEVARLSQDVLKSSPDGTIEIGYGFEGMKIDFKSLQGLQGANQIGPSAGAMEAFGIDQVIVDFGLSARVGLGSGKVAASLSIAEQNYAALDVSADLDGLDFERLRRTPDDQRAAIALQTQIKSIRVAVTDNGARLLLLERGAATQPGLSIADYRQTMATMARGMGANFGTPETTALGEAVSRFVEAGGTLTLTTGMQQPARILELLGLGQASPAAVVQRLGLKAEVTTPR